MKKHLLLIVAFAFALIGCGDTNPTDDGGNGGGGSTDPNMSLVSKVATEYDDFIETWEFSYDAQKRVSGAKINYTELDDNYDSDMDLSISYPDKNTVRITGKGTSSYEDDNDNGMPRAFMAKPARRYAPNTRAGETTYTIELTLKLNDKGYVASGNMKEVYEYEEDSDTYQERWEVEYDANDYIKKVSYVEEYEEEYSWDIVYTWADGNLTKAEDSNYYTDVTYNSDESNNANVNLDLNWIVYQTEWLAFGSDDYAVSNYMGLYGKRSANMVATEKDNYEDYSYEYEHDSKDRINKVNVSYEGQKTGVITISYK